jgi:uncharacterized protein (DUF1778 family)
MDPDEHHLRRGAQQTMRSLTAGLASVTCREPLTTTILNYLKQILTNQLNAVHGSDQSKLIEEASLAVTESNIALATNFVVKTACEKAVAELEKRLEEDYAKRRVPSQEDQPFQTDPDIVEMSEKVPESIRIQPGLVTDPMLKIYDDFSS